MSLSKIIAGVGIHLVTPALGIIAYGLLYRQMQCLRVQSPPNISYFILFSIFDGWLVVLLTTLFWKWSGMASFGCFYLVLIAPLVTAIMAFRLRQHQNLSVFHRTAFVTSAGYSSVMLIIVLGWFGFRLLSR